MAVAEHQLHQAQDPLAVPLTTLRVRTHRERRQFITFPYVLYRNSPFWTPPLRREQQQTLFGKRNPFFAHSSIMPFIAVDASNRIVGRIAAIINGMHLEKHNDGTGFFGFFECVEAYQVADALLAAAAEHLRAQGLTAMRGPTNPSINASSGLLVRGFDRHPSILMPYNPPYYERFLLENGFSRCKTMWAYYGAWKHLNLDRLRRAAELIRLRTPRISVRTPDMSQFPTEIRAMWRIYNAAFDRSWGHAPLAETEFAFMAETMRPIVDPNMVFFLEVEGKPVGFSLSLPDITVLLRGVPDGRLFPFGFLKLMARQSLGAIRETRMLVLAVLPEYQRRGLDTLLILTTIDQGRKRGYLGSELSWVMDDNTVLRNGLEKLRAVIDKEYALFEKRLC